MPQYKANLNNKKILFLSPQFFSYEKLLKRALEHKGAMVTFFDERPSNTTVGKTLLRINRKLVNHQIKHYYQRIIDQIKNQSFDYILICQAEATPIFFLEFLREHFSDSRRILYLWDSVRNKINTVEKIPFFSRIYSFDHQDCERYNWQFRPLFFDESYSEIANSKDTTKPDLFFVGTIHSDRYLILEKIKKSFVKQHKDVFYFYYIPSKLMFYYYKYVKKIIPKSEIGDFHYRPLPQQTLQRKLAGARVVVDIQHPQQTGLTMRTIEMLGANKKVITTNQDIVHYDFYNPKNICVVDRKHVSVPSTFLESTYQPIPSVIYQHYSISYFLDDLLGLAKDEGDYYHE